MNHRNLRNSSYYIALTSLSVLIWNGSFNKKHKLYASCDEQKDMVALYFKPDSKILMETYLSKRGLENPKVWYTCINREADLPSSYIFKPLYGERAAFRLKAIIEVKDEKTGKSLNVGVGRVSTMIGEIKEDDIDVSMPIFSGDEKCYSKDELSAVLDMPSRYNRLGNDVLSKHNWRGRIPGGMGHPAAKVSVIRIPINEQLVVEGYLCGHSYRDNEGHCIFDRDLEVRSETTTANPQPKQPKNSTKSSPNEDETASEELNNQNECPICKYMKQGACKEEFVAWDGCVKSIKQDEDLNTCFPQTRSMMLCMQKHEHYDIMTAGTDYSKFVIIDKMSSVASSESLIDQENKKEAKSD